MGWTTVSTELNNNQTQIRGSDVKGLSVRGGHPSIDWSQLDTKIIKVATVFSLLFLPSLLMKDLSHYIASFGSSWFYTCRSSELLLEYPSHQTPSLASCELW